MSRSMEFAEFELLFDKIKKHHSPMSHTHGRTIKYVHPNIDMRTHDIFSITFRQFGGEEVHFYIQNEFRDEPKSLFVRCCEWLDENPHPHSQFGKKHK